MSIYDELDRLLARPARAGTYELGPDETTAKRYAEHRSVNGRKILPQQAGKALRKLMEAGLMTREKQYLPDSIQPQWVYRLVRAEETDGGG